MKLFAATLIGVTVLLLSQSSEGKSSQSAKPKCITTNLPDFLDLGKCLKGYTDLCSKNTKGLFALAMKAIECLVQGLIQLELPQQVYIVVQFITDVFDRGTNDFVSDALVGLCNDVSGVTSSFGYHLPCNNLDLQSKVLCTGKIQLKLEDTLDLAECIGDYAKTCKNKKPVDENTFLGLVRIFACLVQGALLTSPGDAVEDLVCFLVTVPALVIGNPAYKSLEPLVEEFKGAFGIDCSNRVFC